MGNGKVFRIVFGDLARVYLVVGKIKGSNNEIVFLVL